jgi:uncharacterized protein YndB with AHSA1/START domain
MKNLGPRIQFDKDQKMWEELKRTTTRVSRRIAASPAALYTAFMDPEALVDWLPPGNMTGHIHAFNPTVGGGYQMSLFYPLEEKSHRGKTRENKDLVTVRFEELTPPRRIVETVRFHSDDPAFQGTMTCVINFDEVASETEVTFLCNNLPPGLRPEDNEAGCRLSLEQLARHVA